MLSSIPRSGSLDMDQKIVSSTSSSPLRTSRGGPVSSKSSKSLDRKASPKISSLPEKVSSQMDQNVSQTDEKLKVLEVELRRVKESESNMLESLMSQTKQLEETKIELEEAKLEVRSLQENNKNMESSKDLEKSNSLEQVRAQEEIRQLRHELKLALGAEEKSKKAMDDLAIALKEVAAEAKEAKEKLAVAQTEASEAVITEEKLRLALEEVQQLKIESEESAIAWNAKQEGFRDCMKLFEEEISRGQNENKKLVEARKASRDENSKLRDIMKHAVNEATVVKEALEIARNENSRLQDLISEKDNTIQCIKQELECLKVGEAAARGSVEELKNFLASTKDIEPGKMSASFDGNSVAKPKPVSVEAEEPTKVLDELPDKPKIQNSRLTGRNRDVRSESLRQPELDMFGSSTIKKERRFSSFSSASFRKVPIYEADDGSNLCSDDGPFGGARIGQQNSPVQKKKKAMFRKFADILRRRSLSK